MRIQKNIIDAQNILKQNRQQGISDWNGKQYDFVCPSPKNYPFQWFWDSSFHAIALLHVDSELSKQEIRCLLQAAKPNGFIPHMILWEKSFHKKAIDNYSIVLAHPYYTATIQPPVLARSILRIYEATGDVKFVKQVLPQTAKFFDWLKKNRDPDHDSLISIIQPDESGLDACAKYDVWTDLATDQSLKKAMRDLFKKYHNYRTDPKALLDLDVFNWEDVMVNAIYADGLKCLGKLSKIVGNLEKIAYYEKESKKVIQALVNKCWDEHRGVFWDLYSKKERKAKILTFSSIFPIILEDLDPQIVDRLIIEHLLNEKEFWLCYPIPSVAATEKSFTADFSNGTIWRGPSWVNINWYIWQRLKDIPQYKQVASTLAKRTISMVSKGGFREFFNPYTSKGLGAVDFGWTTLILDMIHYENLGCKCTIIK